MMMAIIAIFAFVFVKLNQPIEENESKATSIGRENEIREANLFPKKRK